MTPKLDGAKIFSFGELPVDTEGDNF